MRASPIIVFQRTVSRCFEKVLEEMLGRTVQVTLLEILESRGIARNEICEKFDQTFEALRRSFGAGARVIQHKIMTEIYHEYSENIDFAFFDKFEDRLAALKQSVERRGLYPLNEPDNVQ
ncbi:MAG TPA: hypothetical protein VE177_05390 [Candidatus Binatus sp.]|nr:hypothetical protein [Candidatus Binatus sp.]